MYLQSSPTSTLPDSVITFSYTPVREDSFADSGISRQLHSTDPSNPPQLDRFKSIYTIQRLERWIADSYRTLVLGDFNPLLGTVPEARVHVTQVDSEVPATANPDPISSTTFSQKSDSDSFTSRLLKFYHYIKGKLGSWASSQIYYMFCDFLTDLYEACGPFCEWI